MHKFVTHDAISQNLFNGNECVSSSAQSSWTEILVNSKESLELVCARMESDWLSTNAKLRKPWNATTVESCLNT